MKTIGEFVVECHRIVVFGCRNNVEKHECNLCHAHMPTTLIGGIQKNYLNEFGKNWKDIKDMERVCKGLLIEEKQNFTKHIFSLVSSKFLNETYTKR